MYPVQLALFYRRVNGLTVTFSESLPNVEVAVHHEHRFCPSGMSSSSMMGCQDLLILLEFGSC